MKNLTMADLLASLDKQSIVVSRGQEVEGVVITILPHEIVLDLNSKSEGILQKRDLSPEQAANLKIGDKLIVSVLQSENESGQVSLGLNRALKGSQTSGRWSKFENALRSSQALVGRGMEVNKGGLIVEIDGVRGFLPSSQVTLSQAANLEELIGKEVSVLVIEVDPNQNRLIFSQKTNVSEDTKQKLGRLKVDDKVSGKVAAVLAFGIFVTLEDSPRGEAGGVEGLVHISEISWEKTLDPHTVYKVGDEVQAKVISVDANTGRVNLSVKQLSKDPFADLSKDVQADDVVKAVVSKVTSLGVSFTLESGAEGFMPSSKTEAEINYTVGESYTCLVDNVDSQKRRVNLVPFVTSTSSLIYK